MNRRSFLKAILAAGVAPYVVTSAGVLMPVRELWTPEWTRYALVEDGLTLSFWAKVSSRSLERAMSTDIRRFVRINKEDKLIQFAMPGGHGLNFETRGTMHLELGAQRSLPSVSTYGADAEFNVAFG